MERTRELVSVRYIICRYPHFVIAIFFLVADVLRDLGVRSVNMENERPASTPQHEYLPALSTATSIRLIKLNVGSEDGEDIFLTMKTCDLNDKLRFAALSYTWGNPVAHPYAAAEPSRPIWIDNKRFLVTPNLWDALNVFRGYRLELVDLPGEDTPFWVDALCIDQSDVVECNQSSRAGCTQWLGRA